MRMLLEILKTIMAFILNLNFSKKRKSPDSKWLIYDHERDEIVCQINDKEVLFFFTIQ